MWRRIGCGDGISRKTPTKPHWTPIEQHVAKLKMNVYKLMEMDVHQDSMKNINFYSVERIWIRKEEMKVKTQELKD
jgi:hypothetical protein